MSGLKDYGIKHLSPSAINQYATDPAHYVLQRLFNAKSDASAAMFRGIASETGIVHGLYHPKARIQECVDLALKEYDEKLSFSNDPKYESERANIPGFIKYGLLELRQYGVPTSAQERVEIKLPDVPVPVIGFTDLVYEEHGIVIDIKTSLRMPSAISDEHARQGAVYSHAKGNHAMRFAYCKPKPSKGEARACNVYEMTAEHIAQSLSEVREIALRMDRFLSLSKDKEELAALLVPHFKGYLWSNPQIREAGRTLYGF